ncbi:hypothetical protein A9Q99_26510 [Gammaproteobacteria bacterium 45_16_T64]|nr:hypothetical protein A9Q99_26510 [Gammaproteobacteria bacterium 45_16_T64]
MDILFYIIAGAAVGFAVGLTGVGGGSLMTPILLLFGFPPQVAVGTDLLYASITKSGGVLLHRRQGTIRWRIVLTLFLGSIPSSLVTVYFLDNVFADSEAYAGVLTSCLGVMLILTATVLLFKSRLVSGRSVKEPPRVLRAIQQKATIYTWIMGVALGVLVTLSSVGAGAFGAAILLILYPRLSSINIIGTDLAHAVPLTLVAGIGHLFLGNVDFSLLGSLLIGSLPAIYVGTKLGNHMPDNIMQPILASTLLALGVKYAFF